MGTGVQMAVDIRELIMSFLMFNNLSLFSPVMNNGIHLAIKQQEDDNKIEEISNNIIDDKLEPCL